MLGEVAAPVLARRLARLVGLPRAVLAPSTLHVVTDLYRALADRVRHIHVDACTYAVSRWGVDHARVRGVAVSTFRTPAELACRLATPGAHAIVCDAICVACRRITPLRELQRLAARSHSWLIVDDSQGIGLLGAGPSSIAPYGRGGGGTLRWSGTRGDRVIAFGSLAKAFGAPLAFVAGSEAIVRWFEATSQTRVYSSPCHAAELAALDAALRVNEARGDALRGALIERVDRFRAAVESGGGELAEGRFPVQCTTAIAAPVARAIDAHLFRRGVRAFRMRAARGTNRLGFIVTADHDLDELEEAGALIGDVLSSGRLPRADRAVRPDEAAAHAP